MEIFIVFIIIIAILVFALIGFLASIRSLFFSNHDSDDKAPSQRPLQPPERPALKADVLAVRRFLQHLKVSQKIPVDQFESLCQFLEENYPQEIADSPYTSHHDSSRRGRLSPDSNAPDVSGAPTISADVAAITTSIPMSPAGAVSHDSVRLPRSDEILVVAELADDASAVSAHHPQDVGSAPARQTSRNSLDSVAPWDQPDPVALPASRSLTEMIAGFMQEKNMRWGELASGILIVMSAIGLVLSLRNELNSRIPYFSSLLFLLITASIIGAGIYTLRRWKLRNTSRGTLVIGLLLIPLNFVAACVLSTGENRRELFDPWYWIAVVVGVTAFGALSWFGSRYLLRRFNAGLAVCLTGCGAAALLYHRLAEVPSLASSSLGIGAALVPTGLLMLLGANLLRKRTWSKRVWSKRSTNRALIQSGIAVFAALAAASVWLVQSQHAWATSISISPLLILISVVVGGMGYAIGLRLESDRLANRTMWGGTLVALGGLLTFLFWLGSLVNPTVFAINSLLIGLLVGFVALKRKIFQVTPMVWGALTAAGWAVMNLGLNYLPFEQQISAAEIWPAIFNGKSGLLMLFMGGLAAAVQTRLASRFAESGTAKSITSIRRLGWITGGVIGLLGCGVALVASLLNREDYFDTMTASVMLLFAGLTATLISIIKNRKRELLQAEDRRAAYFESLPAVNLATLALFLMLAGLLHAWVWNPTLSQWLVDLTGCAESRWAWVFAIHALFFAIAARIERPGADEDAFVFGASLTLIVGTIASIVIVPLHTGIATVLVGLTTVGWYLIGSTLRRNGKFSLESTVDVGVPFVLSSGVLVCVAAAEWIDPPAWGSSFGIRHLMIQAIALSAWSVLWTALAVLLNRATSLKDWVWLVSSVPRVEQVVMPNVVALMAGALIGAMVDASSAELFANVSTHISLIPDLPWVVYAMLAMWLAVLGMIFQQPSWVKGGCLIVLWFLSWGLLSTQFETSRAAASALRWLIPAGGMGLALLIGARKSWRRGWMRARRMVGMRGRSWWDQKMTQRLIDFSVWIVVAVVLVLSTITVAQVMLQGAGSLGGPLADSFFARDKIITFGVPLVLVVSMLLSYAVSERRPGLASVGSGLFQYLAILATVLLVLSPHPKLATDYFIKVLHSTALGMTLFGFAWYAFRQRINGEAVASPAFLCEHATDPDKSPAPREGFWPRAKQLEIHTLINGLLLTALAGVAGARYFLVPDQTAGWIGSIGNGFGLACLILYSALALVITNQRPQLHRIEAWLWLSTWLAVIALGFLAAASDYFLTPFQPWLAFRIISWGFVVWGCVQLAILWRLRWKTYVSDSLTQASETDGGTPAIATLTRPQAIAVLKNESNQLPFILTMFGSLGFAIRGIDATTGWPSESLTLLLVIVGLMFGGGVVLRKAWLLFLSALAALIATAVIVDQGLAPPGQPAWLNFSAIALAILGIGNIAAAFYLRELRKELVRPSFTQLANLVLLVVTGWILWGSLWQTLSFSIASESSFHHQTGFAVFAASFLLLLASLWNPAGRFWSVSFAMLTLGLALTISLIGDPPRGEWRVAVAMFASSIAVMVWGVVWGARQRWLGFVQLRGAGSLESLQRSLQRQLPVLALGMTGLLVPLCYFGIVFSFEERTSRLTAAVVPVVLAIGLACFSNNWQRRWYQHLTLGLVTLGLIFVSWSELPTRRLFESPLPLLVRTMIVLALAMFVYGALIPRWVRAGDSWLKTFREMAAATCVLAIVFLVALVGQEWMNFDPVIGSGLGRVESLTVGVVGLGMVYGLLAIAVRPANDPFSLSLEGRKAYVYIAQGVLAGLVIHFILAMPWLFQFGLKEYWPYIAMVVCFAGVGVAKLLERRELQVLAHPFFNTAAIVPAVTAVGYFAINSQADGATLMLIVGMAYLMIGLVNDSLLGRILAIVFGNLALWMFYGKFENLTLLAHPQLWLIPPALSALIAAQYQRRSISVSQLATIRYISAAVIYISSTGEIFISGLGDQLWPPMILAALSVVGIMAGIMLQVRGFLYFGTLFLLMAMITMVSHAHRSFNHVWPWWAFGIAMGIGILVIFGMFEKRKNQMRELAGQLKQWDA